MGTSVKESAPSSCPGSRPGTSRPRRSARLFPSPWDRLPAPTKTCGTDERSKVSARRGGAGRRAGRRRRRAIGDEDGDGGGEREPEP
eukprot:6299-Pelagococcus_subviridis.AAC.1